MRNWRRRRSTDPGASAVLSTHRGLDSSTVGFASATKATSAAARNSAPATATYSSGSGAGSSTAMAYGVKVTPVTSAATAPAGTDSVPEGPPPEPVASRVVGAAALIVDAPPGRSWRKTTTSISPLSPGVTATRPGRVMPASSPSTRARSIRPRAPASLYSMSRLKTPPAMVFGSPPTTLTSSSASLRTKVVPTTGLMTVFPRAWSTRNTRPLSFPPMTMPFLQDRVFPVPFSR